MASGVENLISHGYAASAGRLRRGYQRASNLARFGDIEHNYFEAFATATISTLKNRNVAGPHHVILRRGTLELSVFDCYRLRKRSRGPTVQMSPLQLAAKITTYILARYFFVSALTAKSLPLRTPP